MFSRIPLARLIFGLLSLGSPSFAEDPSPTNLKRSGSQSVTGYQIEEPAKRTQIAPERFEIALLNSTVKIERWGTGSKGIIFFNHSGPMADMIRASMRDYDPLIEKGYSLFLWDYPSASPFDRVPAAIDSFVGGSTQTVDFSGIARGVVDGIRKKSALQSFLLVGDSLGGGIILWDYNSLKGTPDISFLLISPTEVFMPNVSSLQDLKRTVLVANENADVFLKNPENKNWIEKNKSPATATLSGKGHFASSAEFV